MFDRLEKKDTLKTEAEEILSEEADIDVLLAETPDQPAPAYFIRSAEGSRVPFDRAIIGQRAVSLLKRRSTLPRPEVERPGRSS